LLIPKRHRRTDRQTDGRLTVALPRSALASRGKKMCSDMRSVPNLQIGRSKPKWTISHFRRSYYKQYIGLLAW